MGFAWLVNTREAALAFKAKYNIPLDVGIKYCPPKAIEDSRKQGSIVIPLITVIEGGVRFHLCPLLLQTLGSISLVSTSVSLISTEWSCS